MEKKRQELHVLVESMEKEAYYQLLKT